MSQTVRHLGLGASMGITLFAIVVPLIHVAAEVATAAGVEFGPWDSLIEVFIFLVTAAMMGVFPWGLWILLTDARRAQVFDKNREVAEYLLTAIGIYVTMILLICTLLQDMYAQLRWLFTPVLLFCAALLIYWRWTRVWGFSRRRGSLDILDDALSFRRPPSVPGRIQGFKRA